MPIRETLPSNGVIRKLWVSEADQYRDHLLRLDPASHEVELGGTPVALSAREFAILEALMERPRGVLSRTQLEDRLYGWGEEVASNAVEVHIHNLRRKLGDGLIRTVRGLGYSLGRDDS